MSTQITLEYLSKLLNKPITGDLAILLSSAQKARVHGWLINNGILFDESVLNSKFTIDQLLSVDVKGLTHKQLSSFANLSSPTQLDVENAQIGIDIQRVDELFPQGLSFDPKIDKELIEIFTARELSYAQSKVNPEATLAGIFCAKEAVQKASNTKLALNEMEILPNEYGRPTCRDFVISISHSADYAMAIAMLKIGISQTLGIKVNDDVLNVEDNQISGKNGNVKIFKFRKLDFIFLGMIITLGIFIFFK
jgi:holo-[acyl-carrier protein] synthase